MPQVVTIREAVRRSKADGLPVSECALRQWVKTGAVPVRKVGQKSLLFYPNLVSFLKCEDGSDNLPLMEIVASGIRRADVG